MVGFSSFLFHAAPSVPASDGAFGNLEVGRQRGENGALAEEGFGALQEFLVKQCRSAARGRVLVHALLWCRAAEGDQRRRDRVAGVVG